MAITIFLPFKKETWDRAAQWLGAAEKEYWSKTNANPYEADNDLDVAIDKLIDYQRPHAAIGCLHKLHSIKDQ